MTDRTASSTLESIGLHPCAERPGGRRMRGFERVRDDESHRRIAEVLTEVAVAAMHPARHLGVGRKSSGMLEDPIASATHAAVETLIAHLEDLVETMPRRVVDQLASEQVAAELGLE